MKILHITTSLAIGGAENILFEVATWQKQAGHEVYVINLRREEFYTKKLIEHGISVFSVFDLEKLAESNLIYLLQLVLKWPLVWFKVKRIAPDIIQTWMYLANIYGGLIGRFVRKPVIWGIFAGSTDKKYYSRATFSLIRLSAVLSRTIPILTVSCSAHGRITHSRIGYVKNRIIYVPTGFAIKQNRDLGNANSIRVVRPGNEAVVLGMLARVCNEKDHSLLLRAVASVVESGYNVRLVLAGGVGLSKADNHLSPIVAQYQLQDRVDFLGAVDDIDKFFTRVDLFLLTSWSEGFPTVLGEAMVRNLPCIASNVGDSRILLGDPGQLVAPGDIDQLIAAIRLFLERSVNERRDIGTRNRIRIQRRFTKEKMLGRYDLVYKYVTKRSG